MGPQGRIGALGAVLLIVIASIPPVVGGTGQVGTEAGTLSAAGNDGIPEYVDESTAPPVATKYAAVRHARNLTVLSPRYRSVTDRATERLNGTLDTYRDPVRVSEPESFTDDAVAVQALTAYGGTNESDRAERISLLVATADNRSVARAIRDAELILNASEGEVENRGLYRSAEAHVANANRQFDRAQRTLERANDSSGRQAIRQRAQAIRTLRTAYRQAHQAMHMLDRETGTTMRVVDRSDPIRNGTRAVNRTVFVEVSDLRPWTLGNLTVSVDGDQRMDRPLRTVGGGPLENGSVPVRVRLTDRVNEVTVGVTDADRKPGQGGAGGERVTATLRLDGDGLNDTYEREVLGTDPLDPDSDSSETQTDERDNGTIDGREDFDGDALGTLEELNIGTDPLVADTDGDGLEDGDEMTWTRTNPLVADSNDDGVQDSDEDPDGDGLSHAEELASGTDPLYADIDGDGVDDAAELANNTDPLNPDTDGDFLLDGEESQDPFNTDPLDPDTNGNGVVDGNETYTTTARNESLGATVEVTGEGNVAAQTTIDSPTHVRYRESYAPNATVAPFVDFESRGEFSNATITIDYETSEVSGSEQNLSIYRFNESTQRYERLDSTVDADADTVSANTSHFSTYTVFDDSEWEAYLQRRDDLMNDVDSSESTQYANWTFESMPSSIEESQWTCWVEPRNDGYKDEPADGSCEIEHDKNAIRVGERTNRQRYLNRSTTLPDDAPLFITVKVTAHVQSAWSHAAAVLTIKSTGNETDVYRLENDYSDSSKTKTVVRRVNITQFAGEEVNVTLRADARHTDGDYSWLRAHYISFASPSNNTASTDSDGDGIPDFREVTGVPLATGPVVELDPQNNDTGGDGLKDGEEVNMDERVTHEPPDEQELETGFAWSSNPAAGNVDTDGDGLTDSDEVGGWNIPVVTSNGDPYMWARASEEPADKTIHVTSDPQKVDTDGDRLDDPEEIRETHTDPNATVTYGITADHESDFRNAFQGQKQEWRMIAEMGLRSDQRPFVDNIEDPDLTDGTDSFDFVTAELELGLDQFNFTGLDGTTRTDYWIPNVDEVRTVDPSVPVTVPEGRRHELDPWDPDGDDDGLTDGQEITGVRVSDGGSTDVFFTDPTEADTDDDGYWDGWIGVYDAGYSDDVVLYRHQLLHGISGDKMVHAQAGTHSVSAAPVPDESERRGADIDQDGDLEHSNIHIGELYWQSTPVVEGHPDDGSITPSPSLTFEVDYYEGISLTEPQIEQRLEDVNANYALYGIDISFRVDDRLSDSDVANAGAPPFSTGDSQTPNTVFNIEDIYHNDTSIPYMILVTEHPNREPVGEASTRGGTNSPNGQDGFGTVVYIEEVRSNRRSGTFEQNFRATATHEVGHLLGTGRHDDLGSEIYSGRAADSTPEELLLDGGARRSAEWSTMAIGYQREYNRDPMDGQYIAFSIEELLTIEFHAIDSATTR